jgi:hypothetical protein
MAALYCAVGPDFLIKVIESGSHRWKAHHFKLMTKRKGVSYNNTTGLFGDDVDGLTER